MPWNSICLDGTKSTKANVPITQQNTNYLETVLDADHFFDVGTNEDGRHRQINSPAQVSDPAIATGMDGVMYYKQVGSGNSRIQGYFRNTNGIFQFIPSFQTGTIQINDTSQLTLTSVEPHSFGDIYIWLNNGGVPGKRQFPSQHATFVSTGTTAGAVSYFLNDSSQTQPIGGITYINFGNTNSDGDLNIYLRLSEGETGLYDWKIIYRGY